MTFPGNQPEHIDGQLDLNDERLAREFEQVGTGDPVALLPMDEDWLENPGDTLGPCGCVDYHMADCPVITGGSAEGMTKDDYLDLYAGSYPEDWPDDEGF